MRLTLRTLLAWLDDTLSPAEVREIGKQVAESPFAKELVERLHRVTRQRRLTVPSRSGPDATDPNLVASYLDNELPPEEVAEFEKRCLTSDVHLAEVASVHQILSLIGQKAKVPTEARHRMYHLIKGRESVAPHAPRASQAMEPEPVSEPIQPWVTPEPPRRPSYERFGPAAAVVLLIVALCWSAWMSLSPNDGANTGTGPIAMAPQKGAPAVAPSPPRTDQGAAAQARAEAKDTSKTQLPAAKDQTTPPETAVAENAAPRPELAPGTVGRAEKSSGILLRENKAGATETKVWERLTEETPLRDQDHLLNLARLRSTIDLGGSKVDLVDETDVTVLGALPSQAGKLELARGHVVLHGTTPPRPYVIQFAKKTLQITPAPKMTVGLQRVSRREPGATAAGEPVLMILASEGEVALASDEAKETLPGPGSITFDSKGAWTDVTKETPPSWVTDSKPSDYDVQIGESLRRYMRPGKEVLKHLVEAMEDDEKEVRRLAISSTRAVGGVSLIVPLLNQKENPVTRRKAIEVLRTYLAESPEAVAQLRSELDAIYGQDLAERVQKLLIGFTAKEAGDESTYKKLVDDLSSPEVAVRELALDNLQSLTGRDALAYSPDEPEGKGLRAWKELHRTHELRSARAAAPAERTPAAPPAPEK